MEPTPPSRYGTGELHTEGAPVLVLSWEAVIFLIMLNLSHLNSFQRFWLQIYTPDSIAKCRRDLHLYPYRRVTNICCDTAKHWKNSIAIRKKLCHMATEYFHSTQLSQKTMILVGHTIYSSDLQLWADTNPHSSNLLSH